MKKSASKDERHAVAAGTPSADALLKTRDELAARVRERTAELERANAALETERRRFHEVLDALPVYVVLLTPDYKVPFANRFFRERFGESHGKRCFEYLFGRNKPCEVCDTYTVLKTKAPHEWEWTGPDGRNYHIFDFPFADTDGSPLILEMGIDVTERKQTAAELEMHRYRLEELVNQRTRQLEAVNAQLQAEVSERKQAQNELVRLVSFPERNPNPVIEADLAGRVYYLNPAARQLLPDLDRKGLDHPWLADWPATVRALSAGKSELIAREITVEGRIYHQTVSYVAENERIRIYGTDITERKSREVELRRLNRTLKALSHSNQAMMRATDELAYLNEVCRIVVEDCGHAMVWVGYAQRDEGKTVRPVASAGFEAGYIETLRITWADTERGRGPTGTAIRAGKQAICRNMLTDPSFRPWRDEAIKRGYASSIVLPLLADDEVFGAISIYCKEPDPFLEDEIALLAELANDLAYGIAAIRLRHAHAMSEKALRESEAQYRALFNGMSDGFALHRIVCDERGEPRDYRFIDVNPAFEKLTGLKRERVIGALMSAVLPAEDPEFVKSYGEVARTGKSIRFDSYAPALKKHYQVFAYRPVRSQCAVMFQDITALKELERWEKTRAAYHIAAQTAMDTIGAMNIGVALIRLSGSVASVNPAFEIMTGYSHDDISGHDSRDAIGRLAATEDKPRMLDLLNAAEQGQSAGSLTLDLVTKAGATVPAIVDVAFIRNTVGSLSSIVMTFKDIAELRRAEERLRKNEARLSEAQRIARLGNWDWNIATGELAWSDEIYRIFGMRPQEFGATYDAFLLSVHPEDREMVRTAVDKALRDEQPYDIDHRIVLPDGAELVVHGRGEVFRDETGRPVRMAGTVQDITEHKKAERRDQMITTLLALFVRKSSRKEYLDAVVKVLQQASDCRCIGVRIVDATGHIPYDASVGFASRFMETESDLALGRDTCVCTRVLAGKPEPQDLACVTPDGSFRCDNMFDFVAGLAAGEKKRFRGICVKSGFASVAVVPIRYHDRVFGAIHLADERKGQASLELINFVESIMAPMIGEAISWFDMDRSLRRAGAYNRSLIEASLDPLVTINAQGKITDVNAATEKITGYSRKELIGTDFADYFTDYEQAQSGYQRVFRDGWVQDYALEIRGRDGRVTPVLYNASVYRDEKGAIVGVFAAARDVTERKRAETAIESYQNELRSLSFRLSLAEESARRQLAVALHDTVVQTQALAQIKLDALGELLTDRQARKVWAEIRGMVEAAVQQSRSLSFELSPPILYELGLDPALEWLGEEFQRRHGFRFHFDCAGDKSAVDQSLRVLLFQSARELLTNIVKHAGATQVHVSSRIAGGQITLSVKDDGKGFDPAVRQRGGNKNSLGLFSIRERMRYIGGQCKIESAPGQGAAITLSVPETSRNTEQLV